VRPSPRSGQAIDPTESPPSGSAGSSRKTGSSSARSLSLRFPGRRPFTAPTRSAPLPGLKSMPSIRNGGDSAARQRRRPRTRGGARRRCSRQGSKGSASGKRRRGARARRG
jgi:hypothetical protein